MNKFTPDQLRHLFYAAIAVIPVTFFFISSFFRASRDDSGFRLRESDRKKSHRSPLIESAVSQSQSKAPLRLGGISIQGPPHEILGLLETASENEINQAYRNLMKRYHPDKVGRPGSREWKDAQQIAEAINRAKAQLLTQAKSRSGR